MPAKLKKLNGDYSVVNPETKKVYAKRTTKTKAQKQARLLNALEATETKPKSYREYVKEMFKKRPAGVSATTYMKEVAMKWKELKGKDMMGAGDTLLISPGLGQTRADYVGSGSCCC